MKLSFARSRARARCQDTSLRVWQSRSTAEHPENRDREFEQLQREDPAGLATIHSSAQASRRNMAENAPPGSSKDAAADASRGMPYYERLRRDLRESLQKKRVIDNNLVRGMCTAALDAPYLLSCVAPSRRRNPQGRNNIPRRNQHRQHYQRVRQLHQGHNHNHNRGRRGYCDTAEGSHQRRR